MVGSIDTWKIRQGAKIDFEEWYESQRPSKTAIEFNEGIITFSPHVSVGKRKPLAKRRA